VLEAYNIKRVLWLSVAEESGGQLLGKLPMLSYFLLINDELLGRDMYIFLLEEVPTVQIVHLA